MTDSESRSSENSTTIKRIGIFGGTFDPVHFGHLRPALELCEQLELDAVRMLPCHLPAHKDRPGATTEQRIDMLRLAIGDLPKLIIDTRETDRNTFSYSVETLELFRAEFPDAQLLFFMGMDSMASLTRWHQWQKLFDLAHLVVIDRPGTSIAGEEERLLMSRQIADIRQTTAIAGNIVLEKVTQWDISATRIRQLRAEERDIRFLLPESVREYILSHNLYV